MSSSNKHRPAHHLNKTDTSKQRPLATTSHTSKPGSSVTTTSSKRSSNLLAPSLLQASIFHQNQRRQLQFEQLYQTRLIGFPPSTSPLSTPQSTVSSRSRNSQVFRQNKSKQTQSKTTNWPKRTKPLSRSRSVTNLRTSVGPRTSSAKPESVQKLRTNGLTSFGSTRPNKNGKPKAKLQYKKSQTFNPFYSTTIQSLDLPEPVFPIDYPPPQPIWNVEPPAWNGFDVNSSNESEGTGHVCQLHSDTLTKCLDTTGVYLCKSYSPRCYIIQKVTFISHIFMATHTFA